MRTIATLRADFYAHCVESLELAKLLRTGSYPLAAPGIGALFEMIEKPAARAGLEFEEGLIGRILDDTGTEPGALTLMAFALSALYETREPPARLTNSSYNAFNGVKGAITKRAEEKFVALNADVQAALGEAFKSLVQIDERGAATRRRAALRQFSRSPAAASLIDSLTEARLLVKGSDERGEPIVEVAHEVLFTGWPRLAGWIADTGDDLRLLRSLSSAASEWEHQERKEEYLWPQRRMAQAYAVIERVRPELNQAERHFLLLTDQKDLLEEIDIASTPHQRRAAIGDRLAEIGDTRPGVGLSADGLPDIMWCEITAREICLQDTADTVLVEAFRIAKYPTTWAQYLVFLQAGDGYADPSWWDGLVRDEPPGDTSGRAGNRPAEFVSWYDAMAFCRWLSSRLHFEVRLPTEWEWEASVTGGEICCGYPWAGDWDPRRANTEESGLNRSTEVGMYPQGASRSGMLDMSGNVWEWCLNQCLTPFDVQQRADRQRAIASIEDEPGVVSGARGGGVLGRGPMAPTGAEPRAVRGGGWSWGHAFACVTRRDRDLPNYRSRDHGFRVASGLTKSG
jgi:formylglycine-generating enzyme required for sulfatase activity